MIRRLAGAALLLNAAAAAAEEYPHARACFDQYELTAQHDLWGAVPARMQPASAQMATLSIAPAAVASWGDAPVRFYVLASCEPGRVQFAVTSYIDGARTSRSLYVGDDGRVSWTQGAVTLSIAQLPRAVAAQKATPAGAP